jgi:hypothetical protein
VQIPTVARPKPVQLIDVKVYVVTKDNLDDFLKEFEEIHGDIAYVALSMRDYENLALNIAELRRYLESTNSGNYLLRKGSNGRWYKRSTSTI